MVGGKIAQKEKIRNVKYKRINKRSHGLAGGQVIGGSLRHWNAVVENACTFNRQRRHWRMEPANNSNKIIMADFCHKVWSR